MSVGCNSVDIHVSSLWLSFNIVLVLSYSNSNSTTYCFNAFYSFLSFWEIILFAADSSGIFELASHENVYVKIVENLISQFLLT